MTCLTLIWKILINKLERRFMSCNYATDFSTRRERMQKGDQRNRRATIHGEHVIKDRKTNQINLAMALIDNKKKKHMIRHAKRDNRLYQNAQNIRTDCRREKRQGIFQGQIFKEDALSIFVIEIIPLNRMLRKSTGGYKRGKT